MALVSMSALRDGSVGGGGYIEEVGVEVKVKVESKQSCKERKQMTPVM